MGGIQYKGQITYQSNFNTLVGIGGNDVAVYGFAAVPKPGILALRGAIVLRPRRRT